MNRLLAQSEYLISTATLDFKRYIFQRIDLQDECIGIIGPRGVGKTTLLLQLAQEYYSDNRQVVYLNMDDFVFSNSSLLEFVTTFVNREGEVIILDELHHYQDTLGDLRKIRDGFPELKVLFACSSVGNEEGVIYELSRFSDLYYLQGLSFREYLSFRYQLEFPVIEFDDILEFNRNPGSMVTNRIHPLKYFDEYLTQGHYPVKENDEEQYMSLIRQNTHHSIVQDIMAVWRMDPVSLYKITRIFSHLAEQGPLKPNIEKMALQAGTTRDSLLKFLKYLHKAGLIEWLVQGNKDLNYLNKPDRLYLYNSNLMQAHKNTTPLRAELLETFVVNQLQAFHQIHLIHPGSFKVDFKYRFNLDWPNPKHGSESQPNTYNLVDNFESQKGAQIPLWMLGFLY